MRRAALVAVSTVGLVLAAGCSGSTNGATSTTKAPGATVPPSSTTTTAGPAGSPVPAGFVPQSFTAVSDSDYWVLGSASCGSGRCPALVRTVDGGRSFVAIPAPPLSTTAPGQPTLRFADRLDGYAFVTNGPATTFFSTHDGGASWHSQSLGDILAFATSGGSALVVTGQCGASGCTGDALQRSSVAQDAWSSSALPFTPDGSVELAAHGSELWLLGTPTSANSPNGGALARSTDAGRTFTVGTSPCVPGLGGMVQPTSATNLWAVCPTGTQAGAWRSVDAGVTFAHLDTPRLINSAQLGAASADVAVLAPNDLPSALLRTTDGGATWNPVSLPSAATFWPWIGFTDAQVGAAVVQTGQASGSGVLPLALWRTTDGGATWSVVHFS